MVSIVQRFYEQFVTYTCQLQNIYNMFQRLVRFLVVVQALYLHLPQRMQLGGLHP